MFIGAVLFSQRALNHLVAIGAEVVGVCTLAQSAFNADHVDLGADCTRHGIPFHHTPDVNAPETLAWIAELLPDVIFCFGWSRLIGRPLLDLAPLGVVGYHPAALPANRGRHPLIWALALGLEETASSFFFMDDGADAGDILSQRPLAIDAADDAGTLYDKMSACALEQIGDIVPKLASGRFERAAQDDRLANSWRKRGEADGRIDWRMSARAIHNLVRALARPYVGAHFVHAGRSYTVWKSTPESDYPPNIEPGKVLAMNDAEPLIKCGEHAIRLIEAEIPSTLKSGDYL